jgi:hypothetical protein
VTLVQEYRIFWSRYAGRGFTSAPGGSLVSASSTIFDSNNNKALDPRYDVCRAPGTATKSTPFDLIVIIVIVVIICQTREIIR